MLRSLVKQGAATMMVSLPAKWVQYHALDKGDEVDIAEIDHNLVISATDSQKKSEITIKLTGITKSSITALLSNTYRKGFDRIKVMFDDQKQFEMLNHAVKTYLIGFDVVKKEKDYCIIESITEPSADQFDSIMKKMLFNFVELFELTRRRMQGAEEDFSEVSDRIQKYGNFCMRSIAKKRFLLKNTELYWTLIYMLMNTNRELFHLNEAVSKKISKEVIEYLEKAKQMFELIKTAYLEKDNAVLAKVHAAHKSLIYQEGYSLLKKAKPEEIIVMYQIMSCIQHAYKCNSPLMGIIL